jgi:single-strand DNA-binding protein
MSAHITVTGNLGQDPELRWSQQGKAILSLSVGCTPRRLNKQSNEWENVGEDLWVRATFWEQEAERLAEQLRKGSKVTVEGTLSRRTYQRQDGGVGESLEITGARFLGIIPRAQQPSQQPAYAPQAQQDPWRGGQQPPAQQVSQEQFRAAQQQAYQQAPQPQQAGWGADQGFPQPQNLNPPF